MKQYPSVPGTVITDTYQGKTAYYHLNCFVAAHGAVRATAMTTGLLTFPGHWICETFLYQPATCAMCSIQMEPHR